MSLIGVTASGSSPEVIPLRPSQEAATSVPSTIVSEIGPRPRRLIQWTLLAIAVALAPAPTISRSASLTFSAPSTDIVLGRRQGLRGRGAGAARAGDHSGA